MGPEIAPPAFIEEYERYVEQTLKPARAQVYEVLHEQWRADNYWKRYRFRGKRATAIPRLSNKGWRKFPDMPLGEYIDRQKKRAVVRYGRKARDRSRPDAER
jgi:hypothetical protein